MLDFIFGKKRILGIDVGTSALKMVELELRSGKPYLSNYAWAPMQKLSEKNDNHADSFEIAVPNLIKKVFKEARFKKSDACIAIPAFGGLITLIEFPELPEKDMEQAIKFEAHKYIPISLDEVTISWEVVKDGQSGENNKKSQILLVAASKNKVIAYEKAVRDAGLELKGVEIESIPMAESLVGNDKGNFIIIDIGFKMCNIIYVEKGIVKATRNIDAGGEDMTRTIATSFKVSRDRAEMMKLSGENFFSAKSILRFPSLDLIMEEVSRILEVFPKRGSNLRIDSLILSGGTANLNGLKEFFEEKLKIKTIIGDPFSRVEYDKRLTNVLGKMKGSLSVSVGLALKGLQELTSRKK